MCFLPCARGEAVVSFFEFLLDSIALAILRSCSIASLSSALNGASSAPEVVSFITLIFLNPRRGVVARDATTFQGKKNILKRLSKFHIF